MISDYKALIVVLAIATAVFIVGRRVTEGFIERTDFDRRRNVWFALTILGFVTPSFWLYVAIAMPLMFFAAKRDSNPLALYVLLLFVVPNTPIPIPAVGVGMIFDVSPTRMMSFAILFPALSRNRQQLVRGRKFTITDWLIVAYGLLQIVLFIPYESGTNTLRRAFLLVIDTLVVYLAFSRLKPERKIFGELAATAALVGGLLALLAIFESVRGWLLFQSIPTAWGRPDLGAWLQRGDALRAQVTTGHALTLGYTISFCVGFWLYIQSGRPKSYIDIGYSFLLAGGLVVTYSRGAWLTTLILVVVFMALRPGAGRLFLRVLPVITIIGLAIYLSPLKESVIDRLPIVGTTDQDTIDYRRQLAEVSWRLIQLNPFLGDPFVIDSMEELRQGQGIIDLINGYIVITLYYGFVGLALFVSLLLVVLARCFLVMKAWRHENGDMAVIGASLVACMLASMFFIATAGVDKPVFILAGVMASYVATGRARAAFGVLPKHANNSPLPNSKRMSPT